MKKHRYNTYIITIIGAESTKIPENIDQLDWKYYNDAVTTQSEEEALSIFSEVSAEIMIEDNNFQFIYNTIKKATIEVAAGGTERTLYRECLCSNLAGLQYILDLLSILPQEEKQAFLSKAL